MYFYLCVYFFLCVCFSVCVCIFCVHVCVCVHVCACVVCVFFVRASCMFVFVYVLCVFLCRFVCESVFVFFVCIFRVVLITTNQTIDKKRIRIPRRILVEGGVSVRVVCHSDDNETTLTSGGN